MSTDLKIKVQKCPRIEEVLTFAIQSESSWMTPILSYLQDGRLLQNVEEAKKVKKRVARFTILNDTLYKRGIGIKNQFLSPSRPQANYQTKVTNWTLLKIIKAQLGNAKGAWPEELPNVLRAYKTIARTPTRETPFRLTYGTKAVILVKVGITIMRPEVFHEGSNDGHLRVNLNCLDEVKDKASY
ncbi:uncharacterized protein LOC126695931 [Quercus robur]|uniref:uncharacterized protein LOC126695931 n=1 Tax=Quercus robur TaxID=38942 RepID=UPI0021622AB8|nr:uncharacterized protein LOC126695931 [Quercus robur]